MRVDTPSASVLVPSQGIHHQHEIVDVRPFYQPFTVFNKLLYRPLVVEASINARPLKEQLSVSLQPFGDKSKLGPLRAVIVQFLPLVRTHGDCRQEKRQDAVEITM